MNDAPNKDLSPEMAAIRDESLSLCSDYLKPLLELVRELIGGTPLLTEQGLPNPKLVAMAGALQSTAQLIDIQVQAALQLYHTPHGDGEGCTCGLDFENIKWQQ